MNELIETPAPGERPVADPRTVEEREIAPYRQLWAGFAANDEERERVAAGGLVTSLMALALREGVVDGVVLSRADFSSGDIGHSIDIVTDPDEVQRYGKSVYFNIPIEREWRRLEQFDGRLGLVGLPCQTRILRSLQAKGTRLQNVELVVSLFCGHNNEVDLWHLVLERLGIDRRDIVDMRTNRQYMRGGIELEKADGRVIEIPFREFNTFRRLWLFSKDLCRHCPEHLGAEADLSIGDIFIPDFLDANIKHSSLVVRTPAAEKLVSMAMEKGVVSLKEVPARAIYKAQKPLIVTSGDDKARYYANRMFGHKAKKPADGPFRLRAFLSYALLMGNDRASRTRVGRWAFLKAPTVLLYGYIKVLNLLKSRLDPIPRERLEGPSTDAIEAPRRT
ncbi:Coenzyme F420 hydrogenase/dehydrogenase, beta subunit C-terminal domain [Sphingomicrobium sp. XHP0239]|uniref:Coenzyme F420 hydrogenase/dehydrogenase, beta subunit C-terminal domain n=1 Tax=Sphingomicrobium maritimum TaxID=3133972 RepID=UPI0031CC837D